MLSRLFLLKNKICCGKGCLMCPYEPKHTEGSLKIRDNVLNNLNEEESNLMNCNSS